MTKYIPSYDLIKYAGSKNINNMARGKSKNPAKTRSKKAAAGRKGGKKGGRTSAANRRRRVGKRETSASATGSDAVATEATS
jgi:hypothetical protein